MLLADCKDLRYAHHCTFCLWTCHALLRGTAQHSTAAAQHELTARTHSTRQPEHRKAYSKVKALGSQSKGAEVNLKMRSMLRLGSSRWQRSSWCSSSTRACLSLLNCALSSGLYRLYGDSSTHHSSSTIALCPSINQSVNQSTNQPTNKRINEYMTQSINLSTNQLVG